MSEGPPQGYEPTPSDQLSFAPQTRQYRKDRAIRAMGMQGIPTGGTNRPLYGLGQAIEESILNAKGKRHSSKSIVEQQVKRPGMSANSDGSVVLKSPNRPDSQVKHKDSEKPRFGVIPGSPADILRNVPGGNWGESVRA